jgi:hypothetical protein
MAHARAPSRQEEDFHAEARRKKGDAEMLRPRGAPFFIQTWLKRLRRNEHFSSAPPLPSPRLRVNQFPFFFSRPPHLRLNPSLAAFPRVRARDPRTFRTLAFAGAAA